jgi:hypothetical protein
MDEPKIEAIAINLAIACESVALATMQLREALAAFEEATLRAAIGRIEEDEKCDPFATLMEAMSEIDKQLLMDELAEGPADLETPRKILRPPKRTGPVNKANHTMRRPPRRARSSCYRCRH